MNVPDQYVGALRHSYARRVSVKPPAAAAVAKQVTSKVSAWRARLTAMRMPAGCASAVCFRAHDASVSTACSLYPLVPLPCLQNAEALMTKLKP